MFSFVQQANCSFLLVAALLWSAYARGLTPWFKWTWCQEVINTKFLLVFETETTRPCLKKKKEHGGERFKILDVNGTGKTSNNLLRASVARVSTYAPSMRNGGCSEKLIATTDCVWGPEDSRSRRLEVPRGRSLEVPRTRGPEAPRPRGPAV